MSIISVVTDYIQGDPRSEKMFNEVRSILYVIGLIGSLDHVTGIGADLKAIDSLRAPLSVLPLIRLAVGGNEKEGESKDIKAKVLQNVRIARNGVKLAGWMLARIHLAAPVADFFSWTSSQLWYGLALGGLLWKAPKSRLTKPRQVLTLALVPIGWTAFGKAHPDLLTGGRLVAALIGLYECKLAFEKTDQNS